MMDPIVSTWLQLIARWAHVLGGVIWIGFLFFFALVQLDAFGAMGHARKEAARQLMPRGLWWFRWMAALTLVTGLMLLWLVYYVDQMLYPVAAEGSPSMTIVANTGALLAIAAYDAITARVRSGVAAHLLSIALLGSVFWLFDRVAGMNGRAVWIHVGSVMGIALFVNVWIRVWPAARRHVLPALDAGSAPDPKAMGVIATRARRSIYIAVPLLLLMISNHYPVLYASESHALYFAVLVAAGWFFAAAFLRRASGFQVPKGAIAEEAD